jgi:hypothetical protein
MLASLAQSAPSSGEGAALFFPLLLGLGLGFIPANIAKKKGYSFGWFYVFGVLFFIVALIVALSMKDKALRSAVVATHSAAVNPAMPPPPAPSGSTDPWAAGRSD